MVILQYWHGISTSHQIRYAKIVNGYKSDTFKFQYVRAGQFWWNVMLGVLLITKQPLRAPKSSWRLLQWVLVSPWRLLQWFQVSLWRLLQWFQVFNVPKSDTSLWRLLHCSQVRYFIMKTASLFPSQILHHGDCFIVPKSDTSSWRLLQCSQVRYFIMEIASLFPSQILHHEDCFNVPKSDPLSGMRMSTDMLCHVEYMSCAHVCKQHSILVYLDHQPIKRCDWHEGWFITIVINDPYCGVNGMHV